MGKKNFFNKYSNNFFSNSKLGIMSQDDKNKASKKDFVTDFIESNSSIEYVYKYFANYQKNIDSDSF